MLEPGLRDLDRPGRLPQDPPGQLHRRHDARGVQPRLDAAGNVTSRYEWVKTETGGAVADSGTWAYRYDGGGRMDRATKPSGVATTYAYDGGGNRISVQVGSNPAVTTAYDSRGLPVSSSDGTTYTHDASGELTGIDRPAGPDRFFTYDPWGGLVQVAETKANDPWP